MSSPNISRRINATFLLFVFWIPSSNSFLLNDIASQNLRRDRVTMSESTKGVLMSNVDKMCVRLLAICFLPWVIVVPIALCFLTLEDAFAQMGATPSESNLPWLITLIAAVACVVLFAVQATRIWQWKEDKSHSCPICGCLLGHVRDGRWGSYRKCLGLGVFPPRPSAPPIQRPAYCGPFFV